MNTQSWTQTMLCLVLTLVNTNRIKAIWILEFYTGFVPEQRSILNWFIQNIYRNAGWRYLWLAGSVPLYNVMAVIVLSFFHPERKAIDKAVWIKTLKGIVTNPIIIGIVAGLIWSACKIPMPVILNKTVTSIEECPHQWGWWQWELPLILGKHLKDQTGCDSNNYEVGCICGNFSSDCCETGFRQEELIAILVMLGSATNSKQFCYGKEYGTWRSFIIKCSDADNIVQCIHVDRMAVCVESVSAGIGIGNSHLVA